MLKKIIKYCFAISIITGICSIAFIVHIEPRFESMNVFFQTAVNLGLLSMASALIFGSIHFILKGKDVDGRGLFAFLKNNFLTTFICLIFFVIAFFLLLQAFK